MNLSNQRPTWLDLAHRRLGKAAFADSGWPIDLSDNEILERLLALNLERSAVNTERGVSEDQKISESVRGGS
jgi:hypothetical protein